MRSLFLALIAGTAAVTGPGSQAIPLFFIANHGQARRAVQYMAQGPEVTAYFSPGEILFRIGNQPLQIQFQGSNTAAHIEGIERLPGEVNFLTGPQRTWRLGEAMYGSVAYRDLYPGIDMVYRGSPRFLKSEFVVAPGADPALIRIQYGQAGKPQIDAAGDLVIALDGREFREQAPELYQVRNGSRVVVDGRYRLTPDGSVGFEVANYDPTLALIIDPIVYSTLFGGSSTDSITALAVDSTGAAYVAGFTASYDLPSINPIQSSSAGSNDVFVAKLNPAGNGLAYCTYLGGRGDDRANSIAIDSSGAVYVAGSTTSSAFPTRNAIQTTLKGTKNAFVLKLNAAGNALEFSTYLGGSSSDAANGIAVDSGGNVYVTGDTTSATFPTTVFQRTNRGGQDAFVVKLAAAGSPILYGTYLGGTYDDHSAAIAVDSGGNAYITGSTYSSDFPQANALQSQPGGGQDAFIARLNASGSALIFSTFLGGSGGSIGYPEVGNAIALDLQGNAYVTGSTSSTNFPLLHAAQSSRRGSLDAFIVKISSAGALVNSTYLGGTGVEAGNAIAVDGSGNAYVAGQTYSTDLPVASAFQSAPKGQYDAFVAKLATSGDSIPFLSYLGGGGSDTATGIALDSTGSIYVAGWTQSTDFPVLNGYQSVNGGTYGGFITKIADMLPAAVSVTPNSGSGAAQTFTFQFSNNTGAMGLTTVSALFQPSITTSGACSVTYTRATNTLQLLTDAGAAPSSTISPGSGSQQNSQCSLNGSGSSVSLSGNVLTLNLSITFQTAFNGNKNIYLQANNAFGSSGWQLRGSWTVAAAPSAAAVSVTPNAGTGAVQTFQFLYSDSAGAPDLRQEWVWFTPAFGGSAANSCMLYYEQAGNLLRLINDAGTAWLAGTPGAIGTLQNRQCSISLSATTVTPSGNNLTLSVPLTFMAPFAGVKQVWMYAAGSAANSGWQQLGSWTVPGVLAVSVTPNAGTGAVQTFQFLYSDTAGAADLRQEWVWFTAAFGGGAANSCMLYYEQASNLLRLINDAGTAWLAGTPGTNATLQNRQCSVNLSTTTITPSGNNVTLSVPLTFTAAFVGGKQVWMYAAGSAANSGWQQLGSWTPN